MSMRGMMFARRQSYIRTSWPVKGACKKCSAEQSSAHFLREGGELRGTKEGGGWRCAISAKLVASASGKSAVSP